MIAALVVTRKGDVQEVVVSSDTAKLKAHAQAQEPQPLVWNSGWGGGWGANSEDDDEKSYEILMNIQVIS